MFEIFNFIARPLGMVLMFFYDIFHNYGVAIILLALIIKLILLPFQMKAKRGMLRQTRLQPKIAELQKKHGTNKQKLNEETMKLYKEEGVNPASGCLWGLLPMPILIAMFQVIRQPITIMMGVANDVYDVLSDGIEQLGGPMLADLGFHAQIQQSQWINHFQGGVEGFIRAVLDTEAVRSSGITDFSEQLSNLRYVDYSFLGLNLGAQPQYDFLWNANLHSYAGELTWIAGFGIFLIPFISGGAQFLSMRINRKFTPQPAGAAEGQGKSMQMIMNLMPLFSVYIGFVTPAALGFYWTLSAILQTVQDTWLNKVYVKKLDDEEAVRNAEREAKEAELEAKRLETERLKAEGLIEQNKNTSKRKKQATSKQEQQIKAAEWEKKNKPEKKKPAKDEPGRIEHRKYARGRAYDPDRYANMNVNDNVVEIEDDTELEGSENNEVNTDD